MWSSKMQWRLIRDIMMRELNRLMVTLIQPGSLKAEDVRARVLLPYVRDMREDQLTPTAMLFYMKCVARHRTEYDSWRKETI